MNTKHEFESVGICPANGNKDNYRVTVRTERMLPVEDILGASEIILCNPIYQETYTQKLAAEIGAEVETVCFHSGVKTTCASR